MENSIQFKGARCFYQVHGSGKVLMLVHGYVEEGSMWAEAVKVLSKKYKVVVPDLPGFGKSELPENTPLSMELYADYLHEVLKQEKVKQLVMLGHSMGGYCTLCFAEKYEKMLLGFGLINSHCFEDSPQKKENRKKGVAFIQKYGPKIFINELYYHIFTDQFKKKNQKLVEGLIAKAQKYSAGAVIQANQAMMNRKDKSEVLKNAKVPVLFVNGKEDESAPLEQTLRQASFPSFADFHLFSDCNHMCIFEKKKETISIIDAFCKRVI